MLAFSPAVAERLRETDRQVVVTGAGGWLGKATLEMLDTALGDEFDRRVGALASYARPMQLRSGRTIAVAPLADLARRSAGAAYVLHYAYLGKEKVAELGVDRFVAVNRAINDFVGEYCANLRAGGVFFASSGAAHFAAGSPEDSTREPYGAAKVRDEARFLGLAGADFTVVASRIFNMAGPFINKLDDYALSSIVLDVLRGGPIRIRANRPVLRSFVHVRDVIDAAMSLLVNGDAPDRPFDAAGNEIVEIGDLAARIATLLGSENMRIERPAIVPGTQDLYAGDAAYFGGVLDRMGLQPLSLTAQIVDTAEYLRASDRS